MRCEPIFKACGAWNLGKSVGGEEFGDMLAGVIGMCDGILLCVACAKIDSPDSWPPSKVFVDGLCENMPWGRCDERIAKVMGDTKHTEDMAFEVTVVE